MLATNIEQGIGVSALKIDVQKKFTELRAAVHMREKLLMRQLDVIVNSQQMSGRGAPLAAQTPTSPTEDTREHTNAGEVRFVAEQEQELLAAIRSFGRFQLDNINLTLQDVYLKNEDYIEPADDHETMYKCLKNRSKTDITYEDDVSLTAEPEAIVVDFSRNKSLVEDNAKLMNKSIINITLQEAKDLIRKAKLKRDTYVPPLNLEELDDELESSIADAVSNLGRETSKSSSTHTCVEQAANGGKHKPKGKKPRFKPKITINNCNGTINLRNIASLTINCANEEAVSAEIPLAKVSADSSTTEQSTPTSTNTATSSNFSSNASSRSQSKKLQGSKKCKSKTEQLQGKHVPTAVADASSSTTSAVVDADGNADDVSDSSHIVTCDFYNRLLNEIKKSLVEKPTRSCYDHAYVQAAAADSTCDANLNASSSSVYMSSSSHAASNTQTSTTIQPGKRLILKNFENLKIILEANSGDEDAFHPVQIEQWLAEIISETDLEPMPNTDILEHSEIN